MGLIICDKHGETGFMPFVSKELAEKIIANEPLGNKGIKFVEVIFIDEDDGEEFQQLHYWMSQKCFDSLSPKESYVIQSDEDEVELDKIFDPIMKGGGICGRCFENYLESNSENGVTH
ncbi:hypothetical protein SAMN02745866_00908 [Alteromonadaceae bacterium Bs31]|nr:hypothetical protein SAMN02745866_00908 [Alteromonadaceae bacterium Bs31]